MNLKPIGNKVIVRPNEPETMRGGVYIPDSAQEQRSDTGEVLAVGTGEQLQSGERIPIPVSVGDTVCFSRYSATQIEHEGEKLYVVSGDSIHAVIQ